MVAFSGHIATAAALGLFTLASADPLNIPKMEIAPGIEMPVLSIGTGGLETSAAKAIVTDWLSLGAKGIDTALVYKDQQVVGEVIRSMNISRKELFITTKIPGCHLAKATVELDFKLLGMDYVDLMLIHFPQNSSCTEAWSVLEDYHAQGKIGAIGVSNFKAADLEPILAMAKVKPAVNQIQHNVLRHDDATIAFCQKHGIAIEAYSPLGRSNHSGDITGNAVIKAIAASHNVSTYQIALKWIVQHGHLVTFQSSSQKHQASDADIFSFNLTDAELQRLDSLQEQPEEEVSIQI
mmetsp:Transcript_23475/g.51494  ORF Transcript_23475/g.51494 Transcript_23475/m.51494 type:complete len:294 (-) Transcript_23475:521-1402(-)